MDNSCKAYKFQPARIDFAHIARLAQAAEVACIVLAQVEVAAHIAPALAEEAAHIDLAAQVKAALLLDTPKRPLWDIWFFGGNFDIVAVAATDIENNMVVDIELVVKATSDQHIRLTKCCCRVALGTAHMLKIKCQGFCKY